MTAMIGTFERVITIPLGYSMREFTGIARLQQSPAFTFLRITTCSDGGAKSRLHSLGSAK
jgi:hypothetical protein